MARLTSMVGSIAFPVRAVLGAIGAVLVVVLAVLAADAQSRLPGATAPFVVLDVTVGLAFVVAAAVARGWRESRLFFAAVGVAWLVASFVPAARLSHQALLAIALTAFPTGRPRVAADWVLVALAVPVALLLVPQPAVAGLFAAVAAWVIVKSWAEPFAAAYPAASAAAISVILAVSWLTAQVQPGRFDSPTALVLYELILLAAAIGFPVALGAAVAGRTRLADRLLSDRRQAGIGGLATVLRDAVGDPGLRVYRWDPERRSYVDSDGRQADDDTSDRRWLRVSDGSEPLGAVVHRSAALEDAPTAAAVAEAVRLTVLNVRLQEALKRQLDDLEAARARLLAATDHQRASTAARLREEVVEPIREATAQLRDVAGSVVNREAAEALEVVEQELETAAEEVVALVAGAAPATLGGGGLHRVIAELAERSPVRVTVAADPAASADAELEATLFYVCSEALTNAVKHASASRVDIAIRREGSVLTVSVADDGIGGADASGSGLQGLADRLAARGGRLRVDSPPGAGTIVTAQVPVSRSSSTARSPR